MAKIEYKGLGRRKSSVARITLSPGNGNFMINKKPAKDYLLSDILLQDASQALEVLKVKDQFDINVNVNGGGLSGQAGAIRLGIARSLLKVSEDNKKVLKKAGLLSRDARKKERKKPGLKKARRARQFSKR